MRFSKIYVEITNKCNLNCSFCSNDNRILEEMSTCSFEIVLKKIKKYTKSIYLHVKGEPLLHSKLDEILNLCFLNNMKVKITTNGTLLANKYAILLKYDNIKQINISLHSENKMPDYFEKVFKVSEILSKKIPIVYRIWLLDNYHLDKLSTIIVEKIMSYYHLNDDFKMQVLSLKNIKIKDNLYLDKDNEFIWPDEEKETTKNIGTCLGTRSHIAILVNGDVVPCCLDSKAHLKLGNIFKDDLEIILNTKLFKELNMGFRNNKLIAPLCKNCNYRSQKFTR